MPAQAGAQGLQVVWVSMKNQRIKIDGETKQQFWVNIELQ
jgi:hypothetical protein